MNYILHNYFKFIKNRNIFLKKKEFLSIIIFYILFFIIDYSQIIHLYGQNIIKRCINMYKRIDPLNYQSKLKPFCVKYPNFLNKKEVSELQLIKISNKRDFSVFSRKNTLTHQCCENYNKQEKKIIESISEKVRLRYEKKINKKLYYLESNKATIYKYFGDKSQHLWHVDPQNINTIYNIIICIKKKGEISPLQFKDENNIINSVYFEEGDAALFNGGTTIHQVPPNKDPYSERTVLSIAYTTDLHISKDKNRSKNMCTYIEGGNNYFNIIKIILIIFVINLILTIVSGINLLSFHFILIFLFISLLFSRFLPSFFYSKLKLGNGRSSSFKSNIIILLGFILATLSIKGAIIFFCYFLLTDIFLPSKLVEYD